MTDGCPAPPCPVVAVGDVDLRRRRVVTWPAGTQLHRVGSAVHPLDALNPSVSGGRFSPRPGLAHVYVARRQAVALLETVFHDVGPGRTARRVFQDVALAGRHLGRVVTARAVRLLDLRDEALAQLEVDRGQLLTTSAAHYPCTAPLLDVMLSSPVGGAALDGAVWHSRVAELARDGGTALADDLLHGEVAEAAIMFGAANARLLRGAGTPVALLPERDGWPPLVDEVAEMFGAEVH